MEEGMRGKAGVGKVSLNLTAREAAGSGAGVTAPHTGRSGKQAATVLYEAC